tara:strand:- start:260 stop:1024 length:765 start_codon:yes stop_codon:yes gene_type:complete
MNKLFKIIISNIFILFFLSVSAYAVTGAADVYKVTMRKVELCTGSTGVSSCDNAVVIGTGDKEVDIASVDAGASAASYGEPALLPLGETYTHMRVTIDRKFTIKNSTAIAAGENATACRTIASTDGMYVTDEATDKYTHKPVVANNQTAAEMNVYLVNDQYTRCNLANCSNKTDDQSISYAQGTGSSKHQTQHADGSTDDDHVMIYELTSPYTVALIAPKIDISFGTSAAVSAQEVNELCQIWAEEPVVTITIE